MIPREKEKISSDEKQGLSCPPLLKWSIQTGEYYTLLGPSSMWDLGNSKIEGTVATQHMPQKNVLAI
jgi:hypothetical protein